MPTALERSGNFSQTLDVSGALILIRDPTTGSPFPQNVIPSSRINKNGQIPLNVFPQPNALDRTVTRGAYNYNFAQSWEIPKRQHLFKIDYLPTSKDRFSVRGSTWRADNQGYGAPAGGRATWDEILSRYLFRYPSLVVNYTRTISPSMVNEFSAGAGHSKEQATPINDGDLKKLNRTTLGMTLGQFYPQNNPRQRCPRQLLLLRRIHVAAGLQRAQHHSAMVRPGHLEGEPEADAGYRTSVRLVYALDAEGRDERGVFRGAVSAL